MPYFVPGCELARIGTRTIVLPTRIVTSACHQFMPALIRPDASMYVGMQWAIEIHSAANVYVLHVRFAIFVGARSSLKSAGSSRTTSSASSTRPSGRSICSSAMGDRGSYTEPRDGAKARRSCHAKAWRFWRSLLARGWGRGVPG